MQFVTGPELFLVIMNFIDNTLCFSGYHNVRCVRKQEFSLPEPGPMFVPPGIAAKAWVFG